MERTVQHLSQLMKLRLNLVHKFNIERRKKFEFVVQLIRIGITSFLEVKELLLHLEAAVVQLANCWCLHIEVGSLYDVHNMLHWIVFKRDMLQNRAMYTHQRGLAEVQQVTNW